MRDLEGLVESVADLEGVTEGVADLEGVTDLDGVPDSV